MNANEQKTRRALTSWAADGPWRAKSVLAALGAVLVGLGIWISDLKTAPPPSKPGNSPPAAQTAAPANPTGGQWNWARPFPAYVRLGASYVAGFCIGWFFRKMTRLIMLVVALLLALLAYGKYAGIDTTRAQEEVKRGGQWAQHEATVAENYLKHLLPSAAGGGVGTLLGFRRRNKTAGPVPTG